MANNNMLAHQYINHLNNNINYFNNILNNNIPNIIDVAGERMDRIVEFVNDLNNNMINGDNIWLRVKAELDWTMLMNSPALNVYTAQEVQDLYHTLLQARNINFINGDSMLINNFIQDVEQLTFDEMQSIHQMLL